MTKTLNTITAFLIGAVLLVPAVSRAQTQTPPFLIGKVEVGDPRVLDVTGRYVLEGQLHRITLNVVQDRRGFLVGRAFVQNVDPAVTPNVTATSVPVYLNGKLTVTSTGPLTLRLGNVPHILANTADRITTRPTVTINGVLQGPAFRVRVGVFNIGPNETFESQILPINPIRGFVVNDAPSWRMGPNIWKSNRKVLMPWGPVWTNAVQTRDGDKYLLRMPDYMGLGFPTFGVFGMRLAGVVTDDVWETKLNQVKLGYGQILVRPEETTVTKHASGAITIP